MRDGETLQLSPNLFCVGGEGALAGLFWWFSADTFSAMVCICFSEDDKNITWILYLQKQDSVISGWVVPFLGEEGLIIEA